MAQAIRTPWSLGRRLLAFARDERQGSHVDAVVLAVVAADPTTERILTVDGRDFSVYRFANDVEVVLP